MFGEADTTLQQLLDIVEGESRNNGLELNGKKAEVNVVSQNNESPQINLFINKKKLEQRDQFKYFSSLISSDGCNNSKIASRIAQTKENFQIMKSILKNKHGSNYTRRALECMVARPEQFQSS